MLARRAEKVIIKLKNISRKNKRRTAAEGRWKKIIPIAFICLFAIGLEAKADSVINNESDKSSNNGELKIARISQTEIEQKLFSGTVPEEGATPQEIEEAVEFASGATGVRKDFLMGMLVVESNLGQNTGQCTYREVENDALRSHQTGRLSARAWNTFNHRKRLIEDIAEELNYDYEGLKVSCNPAGYAGTGGALGIPQFMPDTWYEYRDRIKQVTGKEHPDPWNTKDGVVAMALKLSDVPGVKEHDLLAERNAAKMYLSGNTSWKYDWYANQVVYWSRNYRILVG